MLFRNAFQTVHPYNVKKDRFTRKVPFHSRRDLLILPGQSGFPSVIHRWHEAQSGALMVIITGGSLRELKYQILGMTQQDVHALNYHWLTSVVLALLLILGGSLAATKRPGWQALGFIVGIAYLYLGSMALMFPDYAGSWGTIGGVLGLLGGLSYITITLLEVQRTRKAARVSPIGINSNHEVRQEAG